MRRRDVLALGLSSLSLAAFRSLPASAQGKYPDQPIRFIVPRAAGGVVDVVARLWAEQVKPQLGNVIIENQGGGGGIIAAQAVARAKPDGYTLLAGTTSELVISPVIMSTPSYDPVKDLAPIAITAISVSRSWCTRRCRCRRCRNSSPTPRPIPASSYGSAGVGTSAHLCAELFKQLAGLPDIVHVPYKGANPGLADFYAGHLPMFAASISPQVLEMHRAGQDSHSGCRHRPASRGRSRHSDQLGGRLSRSHHAAIHGRVCARRHAAADHRSGCSGTHEVMADKDFQKKLIKAGLRAGDRFRPRADREIRQDELKRWTPLLKASGIQMN